MSTEWVESIKSRFGNNIIKVRESAPGEPEITVAREANVEVLEALKNLEGGGFDHLADLTGYDEYPKSPRFHVVYELISMLRKQRCSVVVPLPDDSVKLRTSMHLWKGANWLERETYDLLGIQFDGHEDLRRILLPESFKGHPLQKDFIVDYRQVFPEGNKGRGLFDPFGATVVEGEEP